ncbi:2-oxoglutarate dehydrogenase E2 component (dihydrolipoamide succinyltransferase) [Natronospira proteinivora]|uniref:Dihydrolipoyllysine-residue succinyltransferase component of 2-oxoglutarate dehydrogenase complex n=1 Tax=Natronospira proteinivora TaxID=1807133 RepID=A0ABT1G520_9GAMM|nr:2-oxoglutarate dehydrogenase complex dihydrolipoyllysine-residue succinyltransferase [Natronospira proteinivora]MCP1726388.1 2-oxoglutarate dehydrogenase E2 component (dihydrolipoamide succinyltransferase) [Natronospira proteinivora]
MSTEVKVPQLPESVSDATLVAWHKSAGDAIKRDENLADLETDKVVLEVPAPADGVLKEIRVEEGTVTSGDVIAIVEVGATAEASGGDEKDDGGEEKAEAKADEGKKAESDDKSAADKLSPSVRRLVEEHDLDPADIDGSGKGGRLTKADVMAFIDEGGADKKKEASKPADSGTAKPAAQGVVSGSREDRRVPMSRMRARIAERMVESQSNAAMLTSFNEVDLTEVMALRKRYKETFEKEHGVRLGFMSFFVKAAVEALKKHPIVNASVEGTDVIYHDYWDIGIAVSSDKGLVVPVVRDCDQKGFAQIEGDIADYAQKARKGGLGMDDLTGGTFTITNGGVFGSLISTPIINPPQSAIMGMHKIQERPMVVDGEIKVRNMMYLALTYDHRIIDGKDAVQFLVSIKESLEDPARLMLQV